MDLLTITLASYRTSVAEALDKTGALALFTTEKPVLLKPNLVNHSPFPVTTPVALCRAVVDYIQDRSDAEIVIAEGCGDSALETHEVFTRLGYDRLSSECNVSLVDLNHEPLVKLENRANPVFPEIYLPKIAFECTIVSLPVLKAHSLAGITGTLKNMMGFAPPRHYGREGSWKKALFHQRMQQSIIDLNRYLVPDFTLMDASVGLAEFHLGGATCDPPVNRLVAGKDPWAVDQKAAGLLELDYRQIPHINRPL
ncbi:MAG: DUF362 domain-containing protein [Desulfobacteraceae bacterium]